MATLTLGGRARQLRFDWRALRRLDEEYDINLLDEDEERTRQIFSHPKQLSRVILVGLQGDEPGLTLDQLDGLIELPALPMIGETVAKALVEALGAPEPSPSATS